MRQLIVPLVAVSLISCGGSGNTPITVAGRTLSPASASMLQYLGIPFVVVTDIPDYCGKIKAAYPEPKGCNVTVSNSASSNPFAGVTGSLLSITAYGASDSTRLNIINPDGGSFFFGSAVTSGAMVSFMTVGPAVGTVPSLTMNTAVSGTVDIGQFRSAVGINGAFDVTFDNGEKQAGKFNATYCDAYEKIFANISMQRTCYDSTTSSTCYRSCSCNARAVSASCLSQTDGGWECSCTPAGGGTTTTCAMAAPNCASDTGTCCSLAL